MSGEGTIRASIPCRERLLTLIGDPIIPPQWRGRAIDLYGRLSENPSDDLILRASDLSIAAELYHEVWRHYCRVELIVVQARQELEPPWRDAAHELLDQLRRGGGQ